MDVRSHLPLTSLFHLQDTLLLFRHPPTLTVILVTATENTILCTLTTIDYCQPPFVKMAPSMPPLLPEADQHHAPPQSIGYLQDPSTSTWNIAVVTGSPAQQIQVAATSPQSSPVDSPQQEIRLPKARVELSDDNFLRSSDSSSRQRAMSDGEWWLTLAPPEANKMKKLRDQLDGGTPRPGGLGVAASAPPKISAGRKTTAAKHEVMKSKPAVNTAFASSIEQDISPLKAHKREYSTDTVTTATTAYTGDDSSSSDHTYESSLFNGSLATVYTSNLSRQQSIHRLIRKAELATLATDLDQGFFTQEELSLGIKHAYSLLQDQVVLRGQVKTLLQEAGWQPGAEEWLEECHALRFKDVRDLVPDTLFKAWPRQDANRAIRTLVLKRLVVTKETESLRGALRVIPGLQEERERKMAQRKTLVEVVWEVVWTFGSLPLLYWGFVLLKAAQ